MSLLTKHAAGQGERRFHDDHDDDVTMILMMMIPLRQRQCCLLRRRLVRGHAACPKRFRAIVGAQ